ncbi:MAG TPA: HEPN domain-containing protein [Gemmataceae bacterium]|nr:HEPN domain-containing protein [Gemmataceae bacterium]
MKQQTVPWVRKAEEDVEAARLLAAHRPPLREIAGFHCQHSAEKYLKALLLELGIAFPTTNDLGFLLDLLLSHAPELSALRSRLIALTHFAHEYGMPVVATTTRQMQAALRTMERARAKVRIRLGLQNNVRPVTFPKSPIWFLRAASATRAKETGRGVNGSWEKLLNTRPSGEESLIWRNGWIGLRRMKGGALRL